MGGHVDRPIKWTSIKTLDGLDVAAWLREQAEDPETRRAGTDAEERRPPGNAAELVDRFLEWLAAFDGMNSYQRVASLFLLVLVPGFVLLWAGRLMRVRDMDGARAFGASILGFGGAALALKVWPGWYGGLPLTVLGVVLVITWRVVRPPLGRGLVLFVLQVLSIVGTILGVLFVSRFLP
jgi:hypothetical protein